MDKKISVEMEGWSEQDVAPSTTRVVFIVDYDDCDPSELESYIEDHERELNNDSVLVKTIRFTEKTQQPSKPDKDMLCQCEDPGCTMVMTYRS